MLLLRDCVRYIIGLSWYIRNNKQIMGVEFGFERINTSQSNNHTTPLQCIVASSVLTENWHFGMSMNDNIFYIRVAWMCVFLTHPIASSHELAHISHYHLKFHWILLEHLRNTPNWPISNFKFITRTIYSDIENISFRPSPWLFIKRDSNLTVVLELNWDIFLRFKQRHAQCWVFQMDWWSNV